MQQLQNRSETCCLCDQKRTTKPNWCNDCGLHKLFDFGRNCLEFNSFTKKQQKMKFLLDW